MEKIIIIKNGVGIVVVLSVVFFSQQPFFKKTIENSITPILKGASIIYNNPYVAKVVDRFKTTIPQKISGGVEEVKEIGENVKEEVTEQKEVIEKKSKEGIKKYIAQKILDVLGVKPEELQTIQCTNAIE